MPYRALLCGYLLAAGCGEVEYAEFVAERTELECEIRTTCGNAEASSCSGPTGDDVLDDCHWFRPSRGERCLDAMIETLDEITDESSQCSAWATGNPLAACDFDEVTRRRRGLSCVLSGLTMGRPLRDGGAIIVAPILRDAPSQSTTVLARAASRWSEAAQYEHASVASFARVAAELTALGAPIDLVRRCHAAARDERRHARAALEIASALAGVPLRFGTLAPIDDTPRALRAVAIEAFVDGCWGEAAAAVIAQVGASRAEPAIADVLRTIAREETRHAELAWATIRWAIDRDPDLAHVLLEIADEHRSQRATTEHGPDDLALDRWGLLGKREIAAIELAVLAHVVIPVLREVGRISTRDQGNANQRAAMLSTVKPNSFATSSPGALAPK